MHLTDYTLAGKRLGEGRGSCMFYLAHVKDMISLVESSYKDLYKGKGLKI